MFVLEQDRDFPELTGVGRRKLDGSVHRGV
jgi:hypothetical protein